MARLTSVVFRKIPIDTGELAIFHFYMYLSSSPIRINTLHVAPTPPPPNPVIDLCHIGKSCQKASTEKSFDNIDRQTDDGWTPDAFLCML